jgi:hypothetical protein
VTKKPELPSPGCLLVVVERGFPDTGLEETLPLKEFEKEHDGRWQDIGVN